MNALLLVAAIAVAYGALSIAAAFWLTGVLRAGRPPDDLEDRPTTTEESEERPRAHAR
jgi:hypothetical protein